MKMSEWINLDLHRDFIAQQTDALRLCTCPDGWVERFGVDVLISHKTDAALERLMPLRVAIVDVALTDGSHLTERVDNVRGTPENPMTRDEIIAKATDLITPVLGATKCSSLVDKIFHLESVSDIRELRPLLQRN